MAGREEQLGEVLERYLSARRAGKPLERDALLRQHPELAGELEECLDSLEFLATTLGLEGPGEVLEPGQEFADYEIVREIARGGMGVVYEAFHLGLERRVALKVLSGGGLDQLRNRERFLQEAKTAAGLHHTNIVPIFEVGELGGVCYYAMQFIEGRSLSELIKELRGRQQLPSAAQIRQFVEYAAQAADALAYAHRRGVVHRDIKPSNLLLDPAGIVWTADFGLAFRPEETDGDRVREPIGTPLYMSPEQASPGSIPVDHRTDIYSLGATLYELLTLRPIFEGNTPAEVLHKVVSGRPTPPRELNRRIHPDLEAIVLKATAKHPDQRYQEAGELAADLCRFLGHEPVSARPIGPVGRLVRWCRRKPALASVLAASLLILTAVICVSHVAILRSRNRALEALDVARAAEARARANAKVAGRNWWEATYQRARATRLSFESGRRWQALELLAQAALRRREPRLRDEAVAALALMDARPAGELKRDRRAAAPYRVRCREPATGRNLPGWLRAPLGPVAAAHCGTADRAAPATFARRRQRRAGHANPVRLEPRRPAAGYPLRSRFRVGMDRALGPGAARAARFLVGARADRGRAVACNLRPEADAHAGRLGRNMPPLGIERRAGAALAADKHRALSGRHLRADRRLHNHAEQRRPVGRLGLAGR